MALQKMFFNQPLWLILTVVLPVFGAGSEKLTKTVLITAEDEKLRDPEGYAAIKELHRLMDDDESGSIDPEESSDFLKEDMKIGGSDRLKREKAFHHNNDNSITVDDLWEAWFGASERMWTVDEVINWLENTVKLPQYSSKFSEARVDGKTLPRMAVPNSSFLSGTLNIKNAIHRHKIQLKAIDVVLFGFSGDGSSKMKDVALSVLFCLFISLLLLYKRQRARSQSELKSLSVKLTQLKSMENHFDDVQKKFEEERRKRQSINEIAENENKQVQTLKSQLLEAERLLENSYSAPLALQPLLRRTCELEMSYISQQRLECIAEMKEAVELIDKLRRKQSSLISSIKLATGASSGTDQIDSKIYSLKARMEKISLAMSECHQRWIEVESLCGFPLMITSDGSGSVIRPSPSNTSSFYRDSGASSSSGCSSSSASSATVIGTPRETAVITPTPVSFFTQHAPIPSTQRSGYDIFPSSLSSNDMKGYNCHQQQQQQQQQLQVNSNSYFHPSCQSHNSAVDDVLHSGPPRVATDCPAIKQMNGNSSETSVPSTSFSHTEKENCKVNSMVRSQSTGMLRRLKLRPKLSHLFPRMKKS